MRTSFNGKILYDDTTHEFIGINLGADYCAEHEFGINGLNKLLGVDTSAIGIDRYVITNTDVKSYMQTTRFTKDGEKYICLTCHQISEYYIPEIAKFGRSDAEFFAKWDENGFAITVPWSKREIVRKIQEETAAGNMTIGIGRGGPFKNGGLTLFLLSAFSEEDKDAIKESHLDYKKLLAAARKTKIAAKLKEAGKEYYALLPQWKNDIHIESDTKYEVVFFLNPTQQHKYNSGWYSVEELEQWAQGTGPVMKEPHE